jgi:hypothetical protein
VKLDLNDQRWLDAAEGWLELGDHLAANEELEQIRPANRLGVWRLVVALEPTEFAPVRLAGLTWFMANRHKPS